jgi:peroxiredoxin
MTRRILLLGLVAMVLVVTGGCQTARPSFIEPESTAQVPQRAEEIRPILMGQTLPGISLRMADDTPFDLNRAIAKKPTILIFFRGGWCPYCSRHLGQLQSIESDLIKLGFQVIAISPDRPAILREPAQKEGLQYLLLSDADMSAVKSLGIAFKVDDATVHKYKTSYGIDLERDSGQKHHLLPVPSVFIVGKDGTVQFAYVNPDYKVRLEPDVLLAAAKAVARESAENKP